MDDGYDDKLVMLAELRVKPDRIQEFLDYTAGNLKLSRSYAGNIAFDILVDENQPGQVRFYEVWESLEAQQAYMSWRVQAGDLTRLLSLLAEPPSFVALRRIAGPPWSAATVTPRTLTPSFDP